MNKQSEKFWTEEELSYLKENFESQTYRELSKNLQRSILGVKHKCERLKLTKRFKPAEIGDVINGWKIVEIYSKNNGKQNIKYAQVESTINDKTGEYRLTKLTQRDVGWPDRRRPDVTNRKTNHNLCGTRLYSIWCGMKNRCLNKNQNSYKNYGGRGIKICKDWLTFMNFYNWAIKNAYDEKLTLDRINNDENYGPENCKWSSYKHQNDNRRISSNITAWGETKNASDWSLDDRCNTSYNALIYRMNNGWISEVAISTPSKNKGDNFRRYKTFYHFCKEHHPHIIKEFLEDK